MTIEREKFHGPIGFSCDGAHCYEVIQTDFADFKLALTEAKSEGWRTVLICEEWMHFCKDCKP